MNVYMLLKVGYAIIGVTGPLPYDINECQRRSVEFQHKLEQKITEHPEEHFEHYYFQCTESSSRPEFSKNIKD